MFFLTVPLCYGAISLTSMTFTDMNGGNIDVFVNDSAMIRCYGDITDTSGNVSRVNASFYDNANSTLAGPALAGRHYRNSSCNFTRLTATTFSYNCTARIHHHSTPGTWRCFAYAISRDGNVSNRTATRTLNSLVALKLYQANLSFGRIPRGWTTGTTDYPLIVSNAGNTRVDFRLDAYRNPGSANDAQALACTSGTIPVGNVRFSLLPNQNVTSQKTALTNTVLSTNSNTYPTFIGQTAYVNQTIYFGIIMPATVSGYCDGVLAVTAISG
jgi:hypothetical protein